MDQLTIDYTDTREIPRLSRQVWKLLRMLLNGPVSNVMIRDQAKALSHTRRISDLRKNGIPVKIIGRDYESGLVWYALAMEDSDPLWDRLEKASKEHDS